jgi:inhibitor of cysteine peptidase
MARIACVALLTALLLLPTGSVAFADDLSAIKAAAAARVQQLAPTVPVDRITLSTIVGAWATVIVYPPPEVTDPATVVVQNVNGAWTGVAGPGTAFPPGSIPGTPPGDLFWSNPYLGAAADRAVAAISCTQSAGGSAIALEVPCDAMTITAGRVMTVTGPASTAAIFSGPVYEFTLSRLDLATGPFDDWAYERMQQDTTSFTLPDGSSAVRAVRYYAIGATNVLQADLFGGDSVIRWFYLQTAPDAAVILLKTRVYPVETNPAAPEAQAALTLALRTVHPAEDSPSWDPVAAPTYTNPAQPIVARSGQFFVIALDSNPTTGFSWSLDPTPPPSVVVLVTSRYQPPAPVRPGAGGTQRLTFHAVGPGQTTITLNYARPWERDTPPARTVQFQVTVE